MAGIIAFLTSMNWTNPTWDIFILMFFVIGALLYGLSLGRDRVITIMVTIYMSLAVVTNAPAMNNLGQAFNIDQNAFLKIGFFLIVFMVLFFFLSRSHVLKALGGGSGSWVQAIIFSVLQVGLLISVTLNFLPKEMTQGLTQITKDTFMSDQGRSAWLVVPIIALVFAPKPKDGEHG